MKWDKLNLNLKSLLIKLGIQFGITNILDIKDFYENQLYYKYEDGGELNSNENTDLDLLSALGVDRITQDYGVKDSTTVFGARVPIDLSEARAAIRDYILTSERIRNREMWQTQIEVEEIINASDSEDVENETKTEKSVDSNIELEAHTNLSLEEDKRRIRITLRDLIEALGGLSPKIPHPQQPNTKNENESLLIPGVRILNQPYLINEVISRNANNSTQESEIESPIQLDSIQQNNDSILNQTNIQDTIKLSYQIVQDSIESKEDTLNTILNIPKLPKIRLDSVGYRIDTSFNNYMLRNPTKYELQESFKNFDIEKFEDTFIDHTDNANKEGYRTEDDDSYKVKKLPLILIPKMVVWHGTGVLNQSIESVVSIDTGNSKLPKSFHYFIDREGVIYHTMPDNKVAFHGGEGAYLGNLLPNSYTLGVEIVTDNSKDTKLFTLKQLESIGKLSVYFNKKYGIPLELNTNHMILDRNGMDIYESWGILKDIPGNNRKNPETGHVHARPSGKHDFYKSVWEYLWKNAFLKYGYKSIENNDYPSYTNVSKNYGDSDDYPIKQHKYGGYIDNPPFVQRILNNDTTSIRDWENPNHRATHKLSVAEDNNGAIVYPEVLKINDTLHDFTNPRWKHDRWDALDSAILRGDTLRFPTLEEAIKYTLEYKNMYPEYFKVYRYGGPIKRKKENSLEWRTAVYNTIDPTGTVRNIMEAKDYYKTAKRKLKKGNTERNWEVGTSIGSATANAAWRKRLELPYDELLLPTWNGDTVSLSKELEKEIPIDTNLVKLNIDIATQEALEDLKYLSFREVVADLLYRKSLKELLEALRHTYKTGEPVGISEFHANGLEANLVLKNLSYGQSPLNVLGRYNIRYDKNENKMYYSDEWDFNLYEWAVPGTPFRIRGAISLDNNRNGGYFFPNNAFLHRFDMGGGG